MIQIDPNTLEIVFGNDSVFGLLVFVPGQSPGQTVPSRGGISGALVSDLNSPVQEPSDSLLMVW